MRKLIIYICTFSALSAFSREKAGVDVGKAIKAQQQGAIAGKALGSCSTPKAARELWVNNVRTIIFNGGDMCGIFSVILTHIIMCLLQQIELLLRLQHLLVLFGLVDMMVVDS
ncbi:MAG: hypothetical protein IPJ60_01300 [Sphingobacteriaceae bacterium]|nr:hypothetical protein [Sphingobacteriaceae bacterium]